MGYYIVATHDGEEIKLRQPKQAPNPEEAVTDRGVIPEEYEQVRVFPVKETPTGDCKFWDKEDMDL